MGSSHRWLTHTVGQIVGLLRFTRVTRLPRYYEPVRPFASHRYSIPHGSTTWRSPFASRRQVPTFRTRACAGLTPSSCRSPLGPSAGTSRTRPRPNAGAWFRRRRYAFDTSSTVHSRSSSQHTPDGYVPPFRHAHDASHWTDAAAGGLDSDPAVRVRGADPSSLVQQGCMELAAITSRSPLCAVVAHNAPRRRWRSAPRTVSARPRSRPPPVREDIFDDAG
jgi:hypothetical protein